MEKKIKEGEIINLFKQYCGQCKGLCCQAKEVTYFKDEFEQLSPLMTGKCIINNELFDGDSIRVLRVNTKNKCHFLTSKGCRLKECDRPFDCISYPLYPKIKYNRNSTMEMVHMMVHKSCQRAEDIAQNKALVKKVESLWKWKLKKTKKKDLRLWFGNKKNYWLDKNVIKILN